MPVNYSPEFPLLPPLSPFLTNIFGVVLFQIGSSRVSSSWSFAVANNSNSGRNRFICLPCHTSVCHWGEAGQELQQEQRQQGLWKEAVYRIAFHGLPSLLAYVTQGRLPGGSTAHTRLSPPTPHKLFIKKMPKDMFTDESNKGSSLNMVLSSHMTLICVKLTNLTSTLSKRRLASNSVIYLCQLPKCWDCT